jgi:ABC-type polysaccharide/polyol phosphate export permease
MIRSWVVRDIRSRYVGSFLGLFWSVIHPLSQLVIYYFVFSVILKVKLGPEYGETHFVIWLLVGLLPWIFFADVATRSPGAVLEQANLIKKTVFPSEILPLSHLVAALINHLITFFILIVFVFFVEGSLSWKVVGVLPVLMAVGLFALGLAWILSSLNVFLRDIGQVVGVLINLWFYLTPVIYPIHLIPNPYRSLLQWNPMLHAVEGYRKAVLGQAAPSPFGLLYLTGVGLLLFGIGGWIFKKLKPAFADVL